MITVTEGAAAKLKQMIEKMAPGSENAGIRLAIKAGGCSGFKYQWMVCSKIGFGDMEFNPHGVRIFVDPKTHDLFVKNMTVDFDERQLLTDGFVYTNPNAKSGCGCGDSFELKNRS